MPKLKSITATKSFTYDPEFYIERQEDPDSVTQEEFEDYVNECALEDFGGGGFKFSTSQISELEKAAMEKLEYVAKILTESDCYLSESEQAELRDSIVEFLED